MSNKRLRILLVAMLVVMTVATFAACTQEDVRITSIAVKADQQVEFTLAEFSLSKVIIVVKDSNGKTSETSLSESMLGSDDAAKLKVAGEHTVTINYNGQTTTLTLKLVDGGSIGGGNTPPPSNIVTVDFDPKGGSKVDSKSGEGQVVIDTEPKPTNGNMTFGGWYTDEKLSNRAEFPFKATMNVTLYAKWISSPVTIKFDVNAADVSPIPDYKVEMGSRISLPEGIVREGYVFNGWYEDQACSKRVSSDKKYEKDTTLFAGYTISIYEVKFDLAGGKYYYWTQANSGESTKEVYTENYEYGATIKNLPLADRENKVEGIYREGFVFRCWERNGEQYTLGTMPAENITLTAAWNIKDPSTFFSYSVNADGTLTITGYAEASEKTASDIIIPSVIDGKKVTAIGKGAFKGRSKLRSVSIPFGVKYIYAEAFSGTALEGEHTSSIPSTIEFIGENAFPDGWEYSSVTYVDSTGSERVLRGLVNNILVKYDTDVGYYVTIPDGITAIADGAFKNQNNIGVVTIGKDVTYIGENAFANSSVNTVRFDKNSNIRYVAPNAFAGTDWERNAQINGDSIVFGNLFFKHYGSVDVVVPAGVKYINDEAFASDVKTINFEKESEIEYVAPNSVSVTRWATNQNIAVINGILVYIKRTDSAIYEIPSSVTTIAGGAFAEIKGSASNVILPSSITEICDYAFEGFAPFNLTLKGNATPKITIKAFLERNNFSKVVPVNIFVNDAAFVSFTEENQTNGWFHVKDRIQAVVVSEIVKVEGIKNTYEIGEQIDLDEVVLTYRTNDNLVYKKVGINDKNVEGYDSLTLYAGDKKMRINFGINNNREAFCEIDYRVFMSVKSILVQEIETSYFIRESLKSQKDKAAKVAVTYVTYRSASGEEETTVEYKDIFIDGQLAQYVTVTGFDTSTSGAYNMTITYTEEIIDANGILVHVLESSVEIAYEVKERDVEKIELTGYKPDDTGTYVYTNYVADPVGTYVLKYIYTEDPEGAYVQRFDFVQADDGAYVVEGVEAADGAYVFDETLKTLIPFNPEIHTGEVVRYSVDLEGATYQVYGDGVIGLRFKKELAGYDAYDGVSEVARFSMTVSDHFEEYSGQFGERYRYETDSVIVPDDGSIWYKSLQHYSTDAFFGKTTFGILEDLDVDNIFVKCTYNQPDETGSRVVYMPLRSFVISDFDTMEVKSDAVATVTYGETAVSTQFTYSVEEYTADFVFDYEIVGDTVVLSGLKEGYPAIVYVPSTIGEKAVVVADGAFKDMNGLYKVVIRAGVTLGKGVFEGSDVKEVLFDEGFAGTRLPDYTFKNTTALETVTLPSSITEIGKEAFYGSAIAGFVVPNSVKTIEMRAFANAHLETVTLGAGVESVEMRAFENCSALKSLSILSTAEELVIGKLAFSGCSSLESVALTNNVKAIAESAFYGNVKLTTVTANKLTEIGRSAFDGCSSLTSFTASSVQTVGDYAFNGCSSLTSFTIDLSTVASIGESAFNGCSSFDVDMSKLTNLSSIGAYAFRNSAITRLIVSATVSQLGDGAFEGCDKLVYVDLSASNITEIADGMFGGFNSLTTVLLPANLKKIGKWSFKATPIASIVIPDSVESIEESAFENCRSLASVTFGAGLKNIGPYVFRCAESLTVINLPNSLETIGLCAFELTGATTLNFAAGSTLNEIAERAFYQTDLTAVTIPASVKSLGKESFAANGSLVSLTIEEGSALTSVGEYAFGGNVALATVNWGKAADVNVSTVIGVSAFENCLALKEISIPFNVTEIGEKAFFNCHGLEKVYIGTEFRDYYTVATTAQIGKARMFLENGGTAYYVYEKTADGDYVKVTSFEGDDGTQVYYVHSVEAAVQIDKTRSKLAKVGTYAFCNTFNLRELFITAENPKLFGSYAQNANSMQVGYIEEKDGVKRFVNHFEDNTFKLHILIKGELQTGYNDIDFYTTWTGNKNVLVQDIHFKFDLTVTA